MTVLIGAQQLHKNKADPPFLQKLLRGEERGLLKLEVHPSYQWPAAYNDVALGRLTKRVPIYPASKTILPVCLPNIGKSKFKFKSLPLDDDHHVI